MDTIFMNSENSRTSEYLLQYGVMNLNYQMDILKKHNENVYNPSIKIYVNKIEKK